MTIPEVSVVLPCFRGAAIARQSVDELTSFLPHHFSTWEVLVVDDGGGDFDNSWPDAGAVRLLRLPRNRGKGAAVRSGMLAGRGRVRIATDIDLPYELELLPLIAGYIRERGFHLVVGDRTLPGSLYALALPRSRRLASAVFSRLVGTLLTGGFHDTQCGLKGYRDDVARELFTLARVDRFAADVELLFLALHFRLDIKRIPVRLRANETSSVRLLRDSPQMLLDLARILGNHWLGRDRSPGLRALVSRDFASDRDSKRHQGGGRAFLTRAHPRPDPSLRSG